MISLRRHVLTLVAVFLALAVGVVLGSTSVATSIRDAVVEREETTAARLEASQEDLAAERIAVDRLDSLAGDLTPVVVDGRLDGRPVLTIVAPGASDEDVSAAREVIDAAGGIDAGRVTLTDMAVDPEADAELQALVLHEAAHAGLPIVTVDHELRLVVDEGVNGAIARPTPESLARQLVMLLHKLADPEFKATAQARSREMAAWWTIANQSTAILDLYRALARGETVTESMKAIPPVSHA